MKLIIAGGGTGGHIYPAISIAEAVQKIDPTAQFIFVGTAQGLETKIIPKAGYRLCLIQSGKLNFQGDFFQKLKSLLKLPVGILQSIQLILKEKPDMVLGVGGYASAPVVLVASLMSFFTKTKTALWEPNAHPGMANRLLSQFVDKAYLVFTDAAKYLKSKNNLVLGMPLRSEIENYKSIAVLDQRFTLLCFGGSQGSMFLNDRLSDFVTQNVDLASQMRIIHQTGSRDFSRMKEKYPQVWQKSGIVEVHEYIYDMPYYYSVANLLFCRGGASTLAEAAVYGVVPVVVPLPAADDHQQRNAEALVRENAAFMFLQNEFDATAFKNLIQNLIQNKKNLNEMSLNLNKVVQRGAALRIAEDIFKSVNQK